MTTEERQQTEERMEVLVQEIDQIQASKVVANLEKPTNCRVLPKSESVVRPLVKLPPEQQPAVWEKAVEKAAAKGKEPTAKDVQQEVDKVQQKAVKAAVKAEKELQEEEAQGLTNAALEKRCLKVWNEVTKFENDKAKRKIAEVLIAAIYKMYPDMMDLPMV